MKEILQEGVSNIVYHFTTLGALENIIANNRINFSDASSNQVDMSCQPEGYKYYLSLPWYNGSYLQRLSALLSATHGQNSTFPYSLHLSMNCRRDDTRKVRHLSSLRHARQADKASPSSRTCGR